MGSCGVEIPVIDCSRIVGGSLEEIEGTEGFREFTREVGDTLRDIGFVYLSNHGLPQANIEHLLETSRNFFFLPEEIKGKYRKTDAVASFHGYSGPGDEALDETEGGLDKPKLKTIAENKEVFDICGIRQHLESEYPEDAPELKGAFDGFRGPLVSLARKVLRSFAVYLELEDPDFFIKRHEAFLSNSKTLVSQNQMRVLYYPPVEGELVGEEETFRLQEHADWGR